MQSASNENCVPDVVTGALEHTSDTLLHPCAVLVRNIFSTILIEILSVSKALHLHSAFPERSAPSDRGGEALRPPVLLVLLVLHGAQGGAGDHLLTAGEARRQKSGQPDNIRVFDTLYIVI